MRGTFFGYLGMLLVGMLVLYCLWLVLYAFWSVFAEWRTNRELDGLAKEYSEKRAERRVEEAGRLSNGCEHDFSHPLGALPLNVCQHCGLAKERPLGGCDHIWRVRPDPIPSSACEKCGVRFPLVDV